MNNDHKHTQAVFTALKIVSGDRVIDGKPVSEKYMDNLINYFEDIEAYEICQELLITKQDWQNHKSNWKNFTLINESLKS